MPNERIKPLDRSCISSENQNFRIWMDEQYTEMLVNVEKERKEREKKGKETNRIISESMRRYQLMQVQRKHATGKSMRTCMTTPIRTLNNHPSARDQQITMHVNEYGYSVSGLGMCNNGFCIMCARLKAKERAENIMAGLQKIKGDKYFITLTIPRQNDIAIAKKELQRRWKKLQNHLEYITCSNFDFCKALDVTFSYTKDVYHLHLHCILIVPYNANVSDISSVWIDANDDIIAQEQCQKIERIKCDKKLSKYVSKMCGLALEICSKDTKTKTKTHDSITLYQLMSDIEQGKKRAIAIYKDFLSKMSRAKTITFSQNWRMKIKEQEDNTEQEDTKQGVLVIPVWWWKHMKSRIVHVGEKLYTDYMNNNHLSITVLQDILDEKRTPDRKYIDDWLTCID